MLRKITLKNLITNIISMNNIIVKRIILTSLLIIGCIIVILLIRLGYTTSFTGFSTQVEVIKPGQQIQPAKTLWDWMQLLIVPVVLVVAAFILNLTINRNEQRIAQKRFELEYKIAASTQQQNLLQTYFDKITELLTNEDLLKKSQVRDIASARTTATISRLDEELQANLLRFLYSAGLIKNNADGCIINLMTATLEEANFFSLNLSSSCLKGIRFMECIFYGPTDFSTSNLDDSEFFRCHLDGAQFSGASLQNAYLTESDLSEADFSQANLQGTKLARVNLANANLTMSNLRKAALDLTYAYKADFTGADLSEAELGGINLIKANLEGAILRNAFISKSTVFVQKANLSGANLTGADLTEANLEGAILKNTKLIRANFTGANLSGANLTGADLTEANLENVIVDENTVISQEQLKKFSK